MEILGDVVVTILVAMTNAAGIGGGEIYVIILLIFYCSIVRYIYNFNQKHPEKNKKAIDYDVIVILLPAILIGVVIGYYVHNVLPGVIKLMVLGILMVLVTIKTAIKAKEMYRKETRKLTIIRESERE
jgi:uncharacterized membrane protein YfcA